MAYEGWLLKIGNYTVPQDKYIAKETYSAYANMQDVDPWTDADGFLHRNAVELKAIKVEMETVPMLTDKEFEDLMSNIRRNILDTSQRKCRITAYIPEYGGYVTQMGYMADIKPSIYGTYGGEIHYNSVKFSFVGGVFDE